MSEETNTNAGQGTERPWTDETFDAERAWTLVENLRSEVATYKQSLADEKQKSASYEHVVAERDQLKATVDAQAADLVKAGKEQILRDRGIPTNLISALTGDSEDQWVEMADMLKSLKGEGKSTGIEGEPPAGESGENKPPVPPDPFQQASNPGATEEAKRLAVAKQIFG